MIGQVLDITTSKNIHIEYGLLIIKEKGEEVARYDLDNISAIIAHPTGGMYSTKTLSELTERRIPFVVLGDNYHPVSMLQPITGNTLMAGRLDLQLRTSLPQKKQAWKQVASRKIQMQGAALNIIEEGLGDGIMLMANRVQSGDPDNIEAQAARIYFTKMYGENFTRLRGAVGINSLLNYGYTVIRAAVARAVVAAGLNPTLGIHHHSILDPFRLVDDLMEPYRPFVDLRVKHLIETGQIDVDTSTKKELIALLRLDIMSHRGRTPLGNMPQYTADSLVKYYDGKIDKLALPTEKDIQGMKGAYRR